MRIFKRGTSVALSHTFYDSSGDITSPSSVHMKLSYPTTGFPYRGFYESTTVTLTQDTTTLIWSGEWDSRVSAPGNVYWHVYTDDNTDSEDGEFVLRGNPANLTVSTT